MCRVLILDDEIRGAKALQPVVNHFEDNGTTTSDIATTLEDALDLAAKAVKSGQPYTVFLVDHLLGPGKDGIDAMGELRKVSPSSDAIIFTGSNDPVIGIRAYEAGAFRYLTKPIEPKELEFVLRVLMQSRREIVENNWRKVFSEMMETSLHRNSFHDVASVVVDYAVQLGFKRAHLLWRPRQIDTGERNNFVGIACAGDKCLPTFPDIKFDIRALPAFNKVLSAGGVVLIHDHEDAECVQLRRELELIGLDLPDSGWWLLPLGSEKEVLGALLLDFGDAPGHLTAHERTLLDFFARQASVTLEHAALYIRVKRTSDEMSLLQRASLELLRISNLDDELFWITVLTTATANFGLKFNRAMLFLTKDNHRTLWGRAAIGRNDPEATRQDWKADEARKYDFDSFLEDVMEGEVTFTPLHEFIRDKEIPISDLGTRIRELLTNGGMLELSEQEAWSEFPVSITSGFTPFNCALLSFQAGSNVLGLVVVDNKHTKNPLNRISLEHLRTLLANVGLVWETKRQRARSEDLLEANYEILGGAGHRTLQETLNIICRTARQFSQADWSIIYPIQKSKKQSPYYEFDLEQFGCDGELKHPIERLFEQPVVGGVTMHILHTGEMIVRDLDQEAPMLGDFKLSDSHFIQREGIKALIGITIKDPDSPEPLGILYLDYLQPHLFDVMDVRHAHAFARLAAVAIANAQRPEEPRLRARMKTALDISETVGTQLNIEEIMVNVLENLRVIFQNTALCVLLYDDDRKTLEFAPRTLQYYEISNPEFQNLRSFPVDGPESRSIACRVARMARGVRRQVHYHARDVRSEPDYLPLNPRTVSELCVSLMDGKGDLLGVLALEREKSVFEDDDVALVDVVAHQLAQAIERSMSSERLAFKETVATMTSWASDIAHDVNSEVGQIRGNAYIIKQVTQDPVILQSINEIDKSAKNLTSVGPWSTQTKREIPLNKSLSVFLEPIVRQRNVNLELKLCAEEMYIHVNPTEFEHVLRHLVRNSARAMDEYKETKEKKITVTSRYVFDGWAEIEFKDYGPGISDEVRAAIFQRKATTKPSSGGYGLLISRQLVDDMGGKITLLPAVPGQGATFSIKLPVVNTTSNIE